MRVSACLTKNINAFRRTPDGIEAITFQNSVLIKKVDFSSFSKAQFKIEDFAKTTGKILLPVMAITAIAVQGQKSLQLKLANKG